MILHCMPPYNQHIPNPALGYLKGFLQDKGIKVKNIYWNLVLAGILSQFHRGLRDYSESKDFFSLFPTIYLCKQLLQENPERDSTPLNKLYSSLYSREEIVEMVHTAKDSIDLYIKGNNLHEGIAGFTLKTYQWLLGLYIIGRLKEMNPDIAIIIGGITSESQARAYMKLFPQADFVILGEGEYPLLHLLEALEGGGTLDAVPSLFYREGTKIISTKPFSEYPSLDSYPFADHTDYISAFQKHMSADALSLYVDTYGRHPSDQFPILIPIWGSRSCSWNKCKFCSLNEGPYRPRSPENIVAEIEYQSEKYQVNSFFFMDTETAGNVKRFKTLLQAIVHSQARREKKYHFIAELSPLFITPEIAHLMQLASFADIQIGFEEMTDHLLEKIQKRHRVAHNLQALKLGKRYGLNIHGLQVIRGIPHETREDIMESFDNLKFLRFFFDKYTLIPGFLRLDKGSPFYSEMSDKEREVWNNSPLWTEIEPLHMIAESDKFEFFGFCQLSPSHLWADFRNFSEFYTRQQRTYEWVEHPEGSFVEEQGLRLYKFMFDRDETDLLIFCDTIRKYSELKERFPHLSEKGLCDVLWDLKDAGFVYYDEDMRWIVSVLDASQRKVLY